MLAGLLAATLSACGVPGSGPTAWLVSGDQWHKICFPSSYQRMTIGYDTVTVQGHGPVTIRDVRLGNATGHVAGSIGVFPLGPSDQFGSFGGWPGFPPRITEKRFGLREAWASRRPAAGATLTPNRRGYNFLIGLSVARGDSTPWLGPLAVDYADTHGHTGTWTSKFWYRLARTCKP